jgi:ABC-2 type transport system ATP-binding protein
MTVVELRCVTKRYDRHVALDEVSLSVDATELVGLVGPNGAGKTTLLRVLAGLVRVDVGARWLAYNDPNAVVYFGGERTLPSDVTSRQWNRLWSGAARPGRSRPLGVLSRGTRQRIGLDAMLGRPGIAVLLLDEPWEGLDPDGARWLSASLIALRAEGTAIVVSSHRIHDLAEVCDRCVFLVDGRLRRDAVICQPGTSLSERSSVLLAAFDRARDIG